MAGIPSYPTPQAPGRAVPLSADTPQGLQQTLDAWASRENRQMVVEGAQKAQEEGAVSGAQAAQNKEGLDLYSSDTEAGRHWNEAARTAYVTGIQNDLADTAAKLHAENPTDPDAFEKASSKAIDGYTSKLDEVTAASVKQQADRTFGAVHREIINTQARLGLEKQHAELEVGISRNIDAFTAAARSGDAAGALKVQGDIDSQIKAYLTMGGSAEKAAAYQTRTLKSGTQESLLGSILKDPDPAGRIEALKKEAAIPGLSAEEKDHFIVRADSVLKEATERSNLSFATDFVDSQYIANGDNPAAMRAAVRGIADPIRRKLSDQELTSRLSTDDADWKRGEEIRVRKASDGIVAAVENNDFATATKIAQTSKLPEGDQARFDAYIKRRQDGVDDPPMPPGGYLEFNQICKLPDEQLAKVDYTKKVGVWEKKYVDALRSQVESAKTHLETKAATAATKDLANATRAQAAADRAANQARELEKSLRSYADSYSDNVARQVLGQGGKVSPTTDQVKTMNDQIQRQLADKYVAGWRPTTQTEVQQALWDAATYANTSHYTSGLLEDIPNSFIDAARLKGHQIGHIPDEQFFADQWKQTPAEAQKAWKTKDPTWKGSK